MPDILLTEATIISSLLDSFCQQTIHRVKHLSRFITNISDIFEATSKQLFLEHRQAQDGLDDDNQENQSIHHIEMVAFASVYDMAKRLKQAGQNIKSLLEKVTISSVKSLYGRIDDVRENSGQLVVEVKYNNQRLKEVEKKIQNSLKSSPSQTLIRNKSGGLLKFDDTRHRTQVLITNKMWLQIQNQYKKLIDEINILNKSRCQFSRLLWQSISTINCQGLMKQMDQFNYSNKQLLEHIVTNVENQCGRSQLLRNRVVGSVDMKIQNDDQIVKNFQNIQAFSELFLGGPKINKRQFQHARNMIMGQSKWGQYFLGCLCSKLYTQVSLDKDKYDQLATVIKIMFANLSQQKGRAHMFYKILYISLRISYNKTHLISELSKYKDHWQNQKRWNQLVDFLKLQLDNQNKQKQIQSEQQKTLMRQKSLNFLLKNNNLYLKASCVDQVEDTSYEALRQINIMLAKLDLDNDFTIKFVTESCNKLKLSNLQKKKLITYHHKHKKSAVEIYLSKKQINQRKFDKYEHNLKNKLIACIQLVLQYIPLDKTLLQIMIVNRKWHREIKLPILRRILIDQPNVNLLCDIRSKVYTALIPSLYTSDIYLRMKAQLPSKLQIFHLIKMDVHRSLNWDHSLKPKLEELLKIFSFYNDKIGYLQGMNYLGQHLLKLNLKKETTYTIFEYIIVKYFSDMFSKNFDLMRLKFYQFGRVMQVYHPKLFKHFENQKIQAQHYLVAWIMTLWGEQQGDIVWILWDGFLLDGWKWWMQVCLWILQVNMDQLMQMNFQQILKVLNDDLPVKMLTSKFNDLFQFGIEPLKIKQSIKKYKITDKMLKLIQQQYLYVLKKFQNGLQTSGVTL